MRLQFCLPLLIAAALLPHPAHADAPATLTIKNHKFSPDHLVVPAGAKFKILVVNADATPEEFESSDLDREKLVTAGSSITVFLGPLDPGTYHFFGDFHQDTAQGVLVAK